MPRYIILFLISCMPIFSRGQIRGNFAGAELELGASVFTDGHIRDVFPVGIHFSGGPLWTFDTRENFFIKGVLGIKWYMHDLPDGYLEHLGTIRIGPEFSYRAFSTDHFALIPALKIDFAWCTNFDTEGGLDEAIQDEPAYVLSERYMRGWGIGKEVGLKALFREKWFIRLSYEWLSPRFKVLNNELQGDLGKDYMDRQHKSLDLNTINLTVGFNLSRI